MERMVTISLNPQMAQNLRQMLNTVSTRGPQEAMILVQITMAVEQGIAESQQPSVTPAPAPDQAPPGE